MNSNIKKTNEDGYTFLEWLLKADFYNSQFCGLAFDDLVDDQTRACWNDGVKPEDYAIMKLEEGGGFTYWGRPIDM